MPVQLFYIVLLVEHCGHVGLRLPLLVAPEAGSVLDHLPLGSEVQGEVYHPLLTVKVFLLK